MIPSQQDVLDTFDSFNDRIVHGNALRARLQSKGFDITATVDAINQAIKNGVLTSNGTGEITRTLDEAVPPTTETQSKN